MLRSNKPKKASTPKVVTSEKSGGSNEAVWDIICDLLKQKNGDKFRKLFYDGDISGYGFPSRKDAPIVGANDHIGPQTLPTTPAPVGNAFMHSALSQPGGTDKSVPYGRRMGAQEKRTAMAAASSRPTGIEWVLALRGGFPVPYAIPMGADNSRASGRNG